MMVTVPTDWQARAKDLGDALILVDGQRKPWTMLKGSDDQVAVDMADQLDSGESLTNVVCTLSRMRGFGETADTNVTATSIPDAPVLSGNVVLQRVKALEAGRDYLLEILHGAAGNRRGPAMILHCPE